MSKARELNSIEREVLRELHDVENMHNMKGSGNWKEYITRFSQVNDNEGSGL